MSSNEEVAAAIEAAKPTGLPICATMTFDTASRSMMGVMSADFADFATASGANFIGANCGIGPAELLQSVVMTNAVGVGVAVRHENGYMTMNMGHVNRKPVASMLQSLHTRRVFDGRFQSGD